MLAAASYLLWVASNACLGGILSAETIATPVFHGPIEKLADTVPAVHELIRSRWSPRAFSSREVSDEDLRTIFEAGRWAASSYNEQPWRFLVARRSDPSAYEKILHLLMPFNQAWAQTAPVLFITAARKAFSHNGVPNYYALHDAGQALANVFLQATALGLHGHGMGGFDRDRARVELGIPEDYEVGAAAALGYLGSPDQLNEQQRQQELARRTRKPLSEIVFGTEFGQPLKL
jgi:nitroreductase